MKADNPNRICTHAGCIKPTGTRVWLCEMHYCRSRRGIPMDAPARATNHTGRCLVDACPNPLVNKKGKYCRMHEARAYRHGDPNIVLPRGSAPGPEHPSWKKDGLSYSGMHMRLRSLRGSPKHCEMCGLTDSDRRYHWAFNWREAATRIIDPSMQIPFTLDVNKYLRLCVPCHKLFDLERLAAPSQRAQTINHRRYHADH